MNSEYFMQAAKEWCLNHGFDPGGRVFSDLMNSADYVIRCLEYSEDAIIPPPHPLEPEVLFDAIWNTIDVMSPYDATAEDIAKIGNQMGLFMKYIRDDPYPVILPTCRWLARWLAPAPLTEEDQEQMIRRAEQEAGL